jgi:hypothetical protein
MEYNEESGITQMQPASEATVHTLSFRVLQYCHASNLSCDVHDD